MPSNIPTGYGQASFVFDHESNEETIVTTLGVKLEGWEGQYQAAANYLFDSWADTFLDDQDNGITLVHVDLYIGAGDDPSGSVRSSRTAQQGGSSMVSIPLNSAVIVNKNTARLGRLGRGRMFVPSMVAAANVSETGIISSTPLASYNQTASDFRVKLLTPVEPDDLVITPVLIHRGPHEDVAPTVIDTFTVQPLIGTRGSRIR